MIEMVTRFILWNPTLAFLPFIGGYLAPWMWHRRMRVLSVVPAVLSWYIGATSWGAYLEELYVFSGPGMGISLALLLAGAGCWFYRYASVLERMEKDAKT